MEMQVEARVTRRRFTVQEYHGMAEAGILHEDDRVELMGGEIVEMSPIGGRHAKCVTELLRALTALVGEGVRVSPQNPVKLDEYWEPQPDVAVLRASERYMVGELPEPEDVLLLIEVSDTTLAYDRDIKLPLYARFGIPEAWIVDLTSGTIERHTEPSEGGYDLVRRARRGASVESEALPGLSVPVDDVIA